MDSIGERLEKLRTSRKLSQRNLALKTGLTHSTISRIERNEVIPEGKTLDVLAKFFNVSIEYLLNGKEDNSTKSNYELDDFLFALYDKTKNLTESQKKDILKIIDALTKE